MIAKLFRYFGYHKIDYGFSCGRHWMSINGKMIAQTSGDDVWLRDEDIQTLVYVTVDRGIHWSKPPDVEAREIEQDQLWKHCAVCGEPFKWHRYMIPTEAHCPIIDAERTHVGLRQRN